MTVELSSYQEHLAAASRMLAQEDLYYFSRLMFLKRRGYKWMRNWHHESICEALIDVYYGKIKRLIINIPPRYSKTELGVINFIAWSLGKSPDAEFIHTSYSQRLAARNSWEVRDLVLQPEFREIFPEFPGLRDDSQARDDWKTAAGGCVYAVGSGGTITGYGAGKERPGFGGAIVIDDPHKADEASSDIVRQGVIDWFQNTLESRKNTKDTPIILIMQRLHENDLTGFLLNGGNGEEWKHLCIPAVTYEGEALWPEKHTIEQLRVMEIAAPYVYSGQYGQTPSPPAGGTIQPDKLNIIDAEPADVDWVRGWDLAGSIAGDATAGVKIGKYRKTGRWVVGHVVKDRQLAHGVELMIVNTADTDGVHTIVSLPQDPGQAGKAQVAYLTGKLSGKDVRSSPESGDKIVRAMPFAAQVNVGNVDMVRGDWNQAYKDELRHFPLGKFDDQVDASSRAFNTFAENQANGLDYLRMLAAQQAAQQATTAKGVAKSG